MPKSLMTDIRTGSVELEDETVDLEDLDASYEQDLDKGEYKDEENEQQQQQPVQPPVSPSPAV